MDKLEKVIKGLECCIDYGVEDAQECKNCPYNDMGDTCERMEPLYEDAIALLKAQEPVKPTWKDGIPYCGKCGWVRLEWIVVRDSYCRNCGRKVKWDG